MADEIELEDISGSSDDDNQHKQISPPVKFTQQMRCIICLESNPPFVRPCNCATYHEECLRNEIRQCLRNRCSVCHQRYRGVSIIPANIRTDGGVFEGFGNELIHLYGRWLLYTVSFGFLIIIPLLFIFRDTHAAWFIGVYVLALQICFIVHAIYRWRLRVQTYEGPQYRRDHFNRIDINLPLIHTEQDIYDFDDEDDGNDGTEDTETAFSVDTEITGTDTESDGSHHDQVAIDIPVDDPNAQVVINIFDGGFDESPHSPESGGNDESGLRRRTGTFTGDDE